MASSNARRQVHYPPILNGIDYLVSVIDLLASGDREPSPHDLKYAVLHLQAASEVLLKARLQIEHWSLTVKDANRTSKQKHEIGDFESPVPTETIRRLKEVVGISIRTEDEQAVVALAKTRNALQHWGLTESAPAVEASAAKVLDFLVRFLDDHLLEELPKDELDAIEGDMTQIRESLGEIRAYVSRRMDRLRDELKDETGRTVKCPDCMQFALVVDGIDNKCHFCSQSWMELIEVPLSYASAVLGHSWLDHDGAGSEPIAECPDCGTETLVLGVRTAAQPDLEVNLCFNCGNVFDDVGSCLKCGRPFVPDSEMTVCSDCFEYAVSGD